MVSINLKETNGLVLAYLGDSVWEVNVREHFVAKGLNLRNLNNKVVKYVNAKAQSEILEKIYPTVEEKHQEIIRKAKNGNIKSFPKSCSVMEYKEATAFEALIAAFYTDNREDLIEMALKKCIEGEV